MENLNQLIEQIRPAMERIAEQLGVASEFLWSILIKQQYINGIYGIGWCLLGIVVLSLIAWSVKDQSKKDWRWVELTGGGMIVIWVFLAMFGFFALIWGFQMAVDHLVNPEYQAIKDIFEFIRGSTGN